MIQMPRTLNLPQGPLDNLPPVQEYDCLRALGPIIVDGRLAERAWQSAHWSTPFVKMDTGAAVSLESRLALLWDDEYLYAAYQYADHEIWGTHVEHHDHVYHRDSDAELFIAGDGVYYELGVNPLNTIYEVFWTWLAPVAAQRDYAQLNRLFSIENFLYFLPRLDERLGRLGELDWELPGLQSAVQIDGALNCPRIRDNGWTVEFALPWQGLSALGLELPPTAGDVLRIGASRCQHFHDEQGRDSHVDWSWNQHGYINMHIPERWSRVRFVE
ncbi:MAG TPA: polyhydroxyalkanoate depolymerase [Thermoflexia bacterium]|nr:polyhydroxyalkanoate depolymerase [Thermoflexia bacterium]